MKRYFGAVLEQYFLKQRYLKIVLMALLDFLFCWASWVGSVVVFTYLLVWDAALIQTINGLAWLIAIVCVVVYSVCGVYKSLWEHSGAGTIMRLAAAVLLVSFSVYVSLRIAIGGWPNPGIGVMAFYFLLTLSLATRMHKRMRSTAIRFLARFSGLPAHLTQEAIRTLVVGAGESASGLLSNPRQQGTRPRKIIGILDNDARKHGYSLHGVPVIGGDEKIPGLVRDFDVHEIVVAVPSMANEDLRRIVRLTPINRCKVRMLTGLSSDKAPALMRELNIADLLGRPETEMDPAAVGAWIGGKTALVTGGGGSIGSELCRQLIRLGAGKIVIFDISESNAHNLKEELKLAFGQTGRYRTAVRIGSVQDRARLAQVFGEFRPDIVFHAAAYKHVPLMEECPRLAIENNVLGTYLTARAAIACGAERFVLISTDKAVNPTNIMGASKRMAELLALGLNGTGGRTEFVCVRFGNVLESSGSVIPLFRRQIEAGGPVTVTHPGIIRYFMTISEASRLVLEAGAMAAGGEVFILDMGEQVKIADLAENMVRMAGLTPDVDIKIEYTGLRPGEKLYEELLLNEEGLAATLNEKIFVIKPKQGGEGRRLAEIIEGGKLAEYGVENLLREFVPEYGQGGAK